MKCPIHHAVSLQVIGGTPLPCPACVAEQVRAAERLAEEEAKAAERILAQCTNFVCYASVKCTTQCNACHVTSLANESYP